MGWEQFTSDGSELAQLKACQSLSIRQRLEALDEMCAMGRRTIERRKRRGLAYIDPHTGQVVPPAAPHDPAPLK